MRSIEALKGRGLHEREIHRPVFFRAQQQEDRLRLQELIDGEPRLQVFDQIEGQLQELVKTLHPAVKYSKEELDQAAIAHVGAVPLEEYGVWVYYPWSFRLVHLLDEKEFALVRTDRNRNKITVEEQALLATKKIGVIGLSVGQSVSLTMALERSFGEIRLADFDTLELSNLNRIRSGVHQMGVNKAVNTAREIAEIDPFLKVTCFTEGINRENIDSYFTGGGRLDMLVEECDSVEIKIIARQKAKELGIPVVMETSDRGMLDVERFDLEPGRPILHGLVEHLDLALAAQARTNEEKMPFVLPIIGLDTMSVRMKASMLEIESSVSTWPQLGSSVVMGGAIGGHVMRRIFLGDGIKSGRWWFDPDQIMNVPEELPKGNGPLKIIELTTSDKKLDEQEMVAAAAKAGSRLYLQALSEADARSLVQAGCLAPSGGNSQPWQFLFHEGRIFIFMDMDRAKSALDPGLRYAYLGLGACLENMLLKAATSGMGVSYLVAPLPDVPQLIAVLGSTPGASQREPSPLEQELAGNIEARCTNRRFSEVQQMDAGEVDQLNKVLEEDTGATIQIIHDRTTIDRIASLCGKAERIRFLNRTCHHDMFVREMRWEKEEVDETRDGIDIETLELGLSDRTGLRVAADPKAMTFLRHWGAGHAMEKLSSKGVRASSAVAVILLPDLETGSAFSAGRAMQRFWLKATSMNILAHPIGAPIFMGIHGLWDRNGILSQEEHDEAQQILKEFEDLIGNRGQRSFFMLRLGRAGDPTARSLRRSLEHVFFSSKHVMA